MQNGSLKEEKKYHLFKIQEYKKYSIYHELKTTYMDYISISKILFSEQNLLMVLKSSKKSMLNQKQIILPLDKVCLYFLNILFNITYISCLFTLYFFQVELDSLVVLTMSMETNLVLKVLLLAIWIGFLL